MSAAVSMLAAVDRLCGQFATATHNSELQIYATLALLLVLGVMLFPPKNAPTRFEAPLEAEPDELSGVYCSTPNIRSAEMLSLVITLLIIALVAGILGFGGIAGAAVGIAKIVFFVALVLFVISLLTTGFRGGFGRRL